MKRILVGLATCFFLFLGMASAGQVLAEEYYTYRDADGKLVISNKKPPAGSKIIKQQDLPDLGENQSEKAQDSKAPPAGAPEKQIDKQRSKHASESHA